MSVRRILNKTTQKKRDVMLSFSNTTISDPFSTTYTQGGAEMSFPIGRVNPSEFVYLWNASARPGDESAGLRGSKIDISLRTSEVIYAVGLKERITVETNNGTSWQWRRICFIAKDDFDSVDPDTADYFRRTSSGMVRLMRAESSAQYWQDRLFDGARNVDWLDPITAPTNPKQFTIKYDRTRTIRSGNDSGVRRTISLWHPMRHNIQYQQEQDGENMFESSVSATGRAGMGNYYVCDIFRKAGPNEQDDDLSTLTVTPESVFYWHEK